MISNFCSHLLTIHHRRLICAHAEIPSSAPCSRSAAKRSAVSTADSRREHPNRTLFNRIQAGIWSGRRVSKCPTRIGAECAANTIGLFCRQRRGKILSGESSFVTHRGFCMARYGGRPGVLRCYWVTTGRLRRQSASQLNSGLSRQADQRDRNEDWEPDAPKMQFPNFQLPACLNIWYQLSRAPVPPVGNIL